MKMIKKQHQKKYRSVITRRITQSVHKLTLTGLVLAVTASMTLISGTNAGFSDVEDSLSNTFSATSLDGRVSDGELFRVTGMNPGERPDSRMTFRNEGKLDFRYGVKYRKTGGDATLCDALVLTVKRNNDATPVYAGRLKSFDLNEFPLGSPFVLSPLAGDNWDFTVTLPTDAGASLEHLSCQWSFDFTAWQTDRPDATNGFSDTESVGTHSIATGDWLTLGDVIVNEVMWMGSTVSSADEWIELKNMTASDIDLSNWDIENGGSGSGHIEIPHGYSIKANSYFLITRKKWDETAINLTSDLAHNKGYTHVSGMSLLNESGEQLTLEDKDNNTIDITPVTWPAGNVDGSAGVHQSMERNDIPGDGTLPTNWHTCVSGAANGAPYWDVAGVNFGTPLAANLSPIVMNEFVLNPAGDDGADQPNGEWIELYNILDTPIDVTGWYFTNADGGQIVVTAENTASSETLVPGKGTLVVYLEQSFLGNVSDTLSLFAPGVLPLDESDDVREDTYSYQDAGILSEGKSFARFPDGEGIWLDPEVTPGEKNQLTEGEMKGFRMLSFMACFEDEKLMPDVTEEICSPLFLTYIKMLHEADETTIHESALLEILEAIRLKEEQELALLTENAPEVNKETPPAVPPSGEGEIPIPEIVPIPEPSPIEPVIPIEKVEDVESLPPEETFPPELEIIPREETPAPELVVVPVSETP